MLLFYVDYDKTTDIMFIRNSSDFTCVYVCVGGETVNQLLTQSLIIQHILIGFSLYILNLYSFMRR